MYVGFMAEGGRDESVQSDPASETEEHTSPLDTLGSMTQSLMAVHRSSEVHALAAKCAIATISDGVRTCSY